MAAQFPQARKARLEISSVGTSRTLCKHSNLTRHKLTNHPHSSLLSPGTQHHPAPAQSLSVPHYTNAALPSSAARPTLHTEHELHRFRCLVLQNSPLPLPQRAGHHSVLLLHALGSGLLSRSSGPRVRDLAHCEIQVFICKSGLLESRGAFLVG